MSMYAHAQCAIRQNAGDSKIYKLRLVIHVSTRRANYIPDSEFGSGSELGRSRVRNRAVGVYANFLARAIGRELALVD